MHASGIKKSNKTFPNFKIKILVNTVLSLISTPTPGVSSISKL